jgi:hypothetical protein
VLSLRSPDGTRRIARVSTDFAIDKNQLPTGRLCLHDRPMSVIINIEDGLRTDRGLAHVTPRKAGPGNGLFDLPWVIERDPMHEAAGPSICLAWGYG